MSSSAHKFEPRLLAPDATGIPAHMRVSNDVRVYEELADPAVTTVVYTPAWPKPVQSIFQQLAKKAVQDKPKDHLQANGAFRANPAKPDENEHMFAFVMLQTYNWLAPLIADKPDDEQQQLVSEISLPQQEMLEAFARLATPGKRITIERHYKPFGPTQGYGKFVFNPYEPMLHYAHIDAGATAIFPHRIGTVLVDQDGLDTEGLLVKLRDSQGRPARGINQSELAGRLWQAPDCSFTLIKGGGKTSCSQFHFFPYAERDIMRHKLIAFARA